MVIGEGRKKERQLLYSRWLMEQHLGRQLERTEHVHHRDGDKTNDVLENLEVVPAGEHAAHHARPTEWVEFICPECGELARKEARNVRHNRKMGKVGPFCSRSCAGRWSQRQG